MNFDAVAIRPIALGDVGALQDCVGAVMRERHFLAYQEPFSIEETKAFVARNMRERNPHWVATHGPRIAGWCDIRRDPIPVHTHCAVLGMGVLESHRGRGIGERLIRAALEDARVQGFERVELSVYAKNTRAHALYRKIGFLHEGIRIRGKKLDGEYDDVHLLVYFL